MSLATIAAIKHTSALYEGPVYWIGPAYFIHTCLSAMIPFSIYFELSDNIDRRDLHAEVRS